LTALYRLATSTTTDAAAQGRAGVAIAVPVSRTDGPLAVHAAGDRDAARADGLVALGFEAAPGALAALPDGESGVWLAYGVRPDRLREDVRAGAMAIGARKGAGDVVVADLAALPAAEQARCAAAFAEGLELGAHRRAGAAVGEDDATRDVVLAVAAEVADAALAAARTAQERAVATNYARALTDLPPSRLTPADLLARAAALARELGWTDASLRHDELERGGFGGIVSVGRGSDLTYEGRPGRPLDVVLVGKGMTMDCGGLNVKTNGASTAIMKFDMSGGAAVLAALHAATRCAMDLNVRVLVPVAENLPGPDATRPGDVIVQRGGRTVEITNTDAEGRVVLADALRYAAETAPADCPLVTVGTLTDGFGPAVVMAIGNDAALGADVVAAAGAVDEVACHVVVPDAYEVFTASDVADAANFSWSHKTHDLPNAAAFMAPFAGDHRWVHLDVADTAYLTGAYGTWPAGATGSPTRTLTSFLSGRAHV
jgi:leucyl aminopeptidase